MSHRKQSGGRVGKMESAAKEPKAMRFLNGEMPPGSKLHTKNNGDGMRVQCYVPPVLANPGNLFHANVGGGRMGHPLAHENEAPFSLDLANFFVKSFCPPDGICLDPFAGSSTTGQACVENGRNYVGIDCRLSQIELSKRRLGIT